VFWVAGRSNGDEKYDDLTYKQWLVDRFETMLE